MRNVVFNKSDKTKRKRNQLKQRKSVNNPNKKKHTQGVADNILYLYEFKDRVFLKSQMFKLHFALQNYALMIFFLQSFLIFCSGSTWTQSLTLNCWFNLNI